MSWIQRSTKNGGSIKKREDLGFFFTDCRGKLVISMEVSWSNMNGEGLIL